MAFSSPIKARDRAVITRVCPQNPSGASTLSEMRRELIGAKVDQGRLGSFCVALRSEPGNLSVAGHPIVNVSFAGKAADNPNFRARNTGFNLPVGFSDPFRLECDARRFTHADNMTPHGADS